MVRDNLNIFTKISFFTGLVASVILPVSIFMLTINLNDSVKDMIKGFSSLAFFATVFGCPLSIVSLFSKEKLSKRVFAFIVNMLPIGIIIIGLVIEFTNEFVRIAP